MKIRKLLSNKYTKLFIFIFIIVGVIVGLKVSFGFENGILLPIINPEWEVYNKLSEEEKANIDYIPMKYIINYDNFINNQKNKMSLFSRNIIPKSYDLRNINGVNTLGPVQDQGYSGLCWLFAMYTSLQSSIYKQHDENTLLSVAQYDFASSDRIREFLEYGISNPYTYRNRFTGGNFTDGARF